MNAIKDAAELYISLGWYPIPLKPGLKECIDAKWKEKVYVPEDFNPEGNIGLRLVKESDKTRSVKLVSVDLDSPESVLVATVLLPISQAKWGRKSKAISQVLYVSSLEKPIQLRDSDGKMLVELRVDHQSMCPPSIHPSGEKVEWLPRTGNARLLAPVVAPATLIRCVKLVATASLIVRFYNPEGNRHDWGLALAGALRQLGVTLDEAVLLTEVCGKIVSDKKIKDRLTDTRTTYARTDDVPTAGLHKLEELTDNGAALVKPLRAIWGESEKDFRVNEKTGKIAPNDQHNIALALDRMGFSCSYNEFSDRLYIKSAAASSAEKISDMLLDRIWLEIDTRFHFRPTQDFFYTFVKSMCYSKPFHPVRNYLAGLIWDGVPRIENWLTKYGGANDSPYVQAISKMMLVAAVRRVRHPGCKFDEIVILESQQGWLKSSALRALSVNPDWFSDDLPLNVGAKELIERTQGKWIIEAAELSGMRADKVEHLKALLSRQVDGPVRMAYGRVSVEVPRQWIVVGTTNAKKYLHDTTGNRRYWPAGVGKFDITGLAEVRDMLWAEAAHLEAQGEPIRLSPELYPTAEQEQEKRTNEDPWETVLLTGLGDSKKAGRERLWEILSVPAERRDHRGQKRIRDIMIRNNWKYQAVWLDGATEKGWAKQASLDIGKE